MPDKPENSAFKLLSSRKTLVMATADFALFRLVLDSGLYVRGFGQAFEVSPDMKNAKHVTR